MFGCVGHNLTKSFDKVKGFVKGKLVFMSEVRLQNESEHCSLIRLIISCPTKWPVQLLLSFVLAVPMEYERLLLSARCSTTSLPPILSKTLRKSTRLLVHLKHTWLSTK